MKRARKKGSGVSVPSFMETDERQNGNTGAAPQNHRRTKKKKKKKHTGIKVFLFLIFAALLAFFIAMGMGWGQSGDDEGALQPVDMEKGKLNVLLLGVDKEGLRTDAMMLVSYDLIEPGAKLISIPRDTQIKVLDRKVTRKINEVHAMHDKNGDLIGPMGSIKAVEALTSVPIHYYVEFNFDAIDELAKIVGGVEFDVPDIEGNGKGMNYDDPAQDLHIHLSPGPQKLTGNQIQQFLRYRKSNSNTVDGSDTSRVQRQQEFLKAVIDQKVNLSLIAKVPSIYSKIKKNTKTNFSSADMVKYAKYLNGMSAERLSTFSLPGEDKHTSKAWYFICDLGATADLIRSEFDYPAEDLSNEININDLSGTKKVLSSKTKSSSPAPENNYDGDIPEKGSEKASSSDKQGSEKASSSDKQESEKKADKAPDETPSPENDNKTKASSKDTNKSSAEETEPSAAPFEPEDDNEGLTQEPESDISGSENSNDDQTIDNSSSDTGEDDEVLTLE